MPDDLIKILVITLHSAKKEDLGSRLNAISHVWGFGAITPCGSIDIKGSSVFGDNAGFLYSTQKKDRGQEENIKDYSGFIEEARRRGVSVRILPVESVYKSWAEYAIMPAEM